MTVRMLLAGDIGGTKTRLGVFSRERGFRSPLVEVDFVSARYPDFTTMIKEFLGRIDFAVRDACFGVAGPVMHGVAKVTNLPWVLDEKRLERDLRLSSIKLLNDLEALACAVPLLEASDLHTLNKGRPVPGGNIAILAPGTGLGEAFLTWDGKRYVSHASEGGHADFAPNTPLERELLRYLQGRFDHVSYEKVCSGAGMPNIYRFLRDRKHFEEPPWLSAKITREEDFTPVIVSNALDSRNQTDLCVKTLDLFVSVLGAEAGNMALRVLAANGVYIGGGIPRRIVRFLENDRFMRSFRRKGRMSNLVAQIPVYVILNPDVALMGAAWYGSHYIHS